MQTDILPGQDTKLIPWLDLFAASAETNAEVLGLTESQVEALSDLAQEFQQAMTEMEAARNAAIAATARKNEVRQRAEEVFRNVARVISANAEIEPKYKADLGLSIENQPSGPVRIPLGLGVTMDVSGVNTLRWNRSGNSRATMFVVEADHYDGLGWRVVDVCTRLSFVHKGQKVGKKVSYRVYATRAGKRSVPSMAVSAYNEGPVLISASLAA